MVIKYGTNWLITDSYEIYSKAMYEFQYVEGSKQVIIECEGLRRVPSGDFYMLIYINKIHEWAFPKGEQIDETKRTEIQKNCKEGWNFLNTTVEFE